MAVLARGCWSPGPHLLRQEMLSLLCSPAGRGRELVWHRILVLLASAPSQG